MTMHYRSMCSKLLILGLFWCFVLPVHCQIAEGRSSLGLNSGLPKNNEIDLHNVQSTGNRLRGKRSEQAKCQICERYPSNPQSNKTLDDALKFLAENNKKAIEIARQSNIAGWGYDSNLTEFNKQVMLDQNLKQAQFDLETWTEAKSFAWKQFNDSKIKRWFKTLTVYNNLAIGETKYKELNLINADLVDIYSKAKICKYKSKDDCNLELNPDLTLLLKKSRDYDELKHVWVEWRNQSGKKMRSKYLRYVQLMNEQANKNGNMWAQDWSNANKEKLLPFPERVKTDLSQNLKEKGLTAKDIFKIGESFFESLGLQKLPDEFWNNSILEKPKDRELICHASAWDFDSKDVRIKQCTRIEHEDFVVAHHELGHVYYYTSYAHQPFAFKNGANNGFHEAIGDCIALSVQLPQHLKTIGLLKENESDTNSSAAAQNATSAQEQDELNFLMQMALQKIAFLPFGYLIDKYRWDLFSGKIKEDQLNSEWWKLRAELQGVCPPVLRTEDDFDPGAKYHVVASVPYLRYFVSHILQFQFHKYLCDASGYKGKLNQCDIYGSKDAGKRLQSTLALGSSVPWPEALKVISNGTESKMNADVVSEYFKPLIDWLKKQLTDQDVIGWKISNPNICPNHH